MDESHAFVRWVGREPYELSTNVNGIFVLAWKSGREETAEYDRNDF